MPESFLIDHFHFCPRCSSERFVRQGANARRCEACGFVFFFNPATAAAVVLENTAGEILLIERARDPGKGLYGLPGGFVEKGEKAEMALRRELQEELGVDLLTIEYLCSTTNRYTYKDVTYDVLDINFSGTCGDQQIKADASEVAHYVFFPKNKLPLDKFAFQSNREATEAHLLKYR